MPLYTKETNSFVVDLNNNMWSKLFLPLQIFNSQCQLITLYKYDWHNVASMYLCILGASSQNTYCIPMHRWTIGEFSWTKFNFFFYKNPFQDPPRPSTKKQPHASKYIPPQKQLNLRGRPYQHVCKLHSLTHIVVNDDSHTLMH